ncbi:MAG: cell division protein FtsQ/DivIB [Hyphomicrobiales bacterium]
MRNRKVVKMLTWVFSLFLFIGLLFIIKYQRRNMYCNDFLVKIDSPNSKSFVTNEEITRKLADNGFLPDSLKIKDIDLNELESVIISDPFVKAVDFSFSFDGNLYIKIFEKEPLIRIFTKNKSSFFLCTDGTIVPADLDGAAHVPVANGNITIPNVKSVINKSVIEQDTISSCMKDLYQLTTLILKNDFLKSQIEQIYVLDNGEYQLIPKLGNHIIEFGKPEDLKSKLENLEVFYTKGINQVGWNKYDKISLKFNNQVVCTKN